jgi:hypothetical protein
MKISYPDAIKWSILLTGKTIQDIVLSKSFKSDCKNTLLQLSENNYLITVEAVTEKFLQEFEPHYRAMIQTKERPEVIDIRRHIKFVKTKRLYSAFVLRKNSVFVGALIFREYNNKISCAFKTFPHTLDFEYRSNLASVIDFYGIQYAIDRRLTHYVLGKDRNKYGEFADVGLARYKLAMGALPYAAERSVLVDFETKCELENESLIFYSALSNDLSLTNGLIFTDFTETEIGNKYGMMYKQKDILFNTQVRTF